MDLGIVKRELGLNGDSPSAQFDADIYEDAGDLDFSESSQPIYLTRIPKFLWKTWSQIHDDQEIQLGTVRVEGSLEKPNKMSVMLSSDASINELVPKEYNLHITNESSTNTFVFTEKDLPGYNNRLKGPNRQTQDSASLPFSQAAPRTNFQDRLKAGSRIDKTKRQQSYYRKAIPKKTGVTGQVHTELNCLPVENEEYRRIMDTRARHELKPKRETQVLKGSVSSYAGNVLNPGALGSAGFQNFIKTSAGGKTKSQDTKAARIPENELLDLIAGCFKKYRYWTLKIMKAELNQPEAYLRETLDRVAVHIKTGKYSGNYQLKPEIAAGVYGNPHRFDHRAQGGLAPEATFGMDGTSETGDGFAVDDDGNIKMEDAPL